ncbi:MAG: hypothetical protein R3B70_16070 [Polyangiaceae bacterium]
MPRTREDVETYLYQLDRRFEEQHGTLLVSTGAGSPPIAIQVAPPIVVLRVTIGQVPQDSAHKLRLYEQLLKFNATDLMHSSYGIDGEQVVLSGALALDNLDENEIEATLSDMDLALVRHVPGLFEAARA